VIDTRIKNVEKVRNSPQKVPEKVQKKPGKSPKKVQSLLRRRLGQTAPETTGPTTEIGRLGGLAVTAQAITTIEDEIRVAIPDAHIEVSYLAKDLTRHDAASLITRLERHLQRLPDTIADLNQEASSAKAEADRAAARIGVPWDRTEELVDLRRHQQEVEEQLAATALCQWC